MLLFGLLDLSLLVEFDDLLLVAERGGRVVLDEVDHQVVEAVVFKHLVERAKEARVVVVLGCCVTQIVISVTNDCARTRTTRTRTRTTAHADN